MRIAVASLEAAVREAERMRSAGEATWFRGQTRNWPLLASYTRLQEAEQEAARERMGRFLRWRNTVPALEGLLADDDAALATAQHYGLATPFVDFTTDPRVAAFFAAHDPPAEDGGDELSCIICLDIEDFVSFCEALAAAYPEASKAKPIEVRVPELWRLEAQSGVFLEYPFDAGFERMHYDFDRIVFPTERDAAVLERLIPRQDIYPRQKSDLEVHLDRYFTLERRHRGSLRIEELRKRGLIHVISMDEPPDGVVAECFGPSGLPLHESWQAEALTDWVLPREENWVPLSGAPSASIRYPSGDDGESKIRALREQFSAILEKQPDLRSTPVNWRLLGVSEPEGLSRTLELLWNGLRRWPYSSPDVAQALATLVELGILLARHPEARRDARAKQELLSSHLGGAITVEIGIEDGSLTQGLANTDLLRRAVRDDFADFLHDDWRDQIVGLRDVLQAARDPRRAMVFDRLQSIFCTQIAPTHLLLTAEESTRARLYSIARATVIGLP